MSVCPEVTSWNTEGYTDSDAAVVRVPGQFNGEAIIFLMDTGASRCFLRKEVWDRVGQGRLRTCDSRVLQANSEPLQIIGLGTVLVTLDNVVFTTEVTVCEKLTDAYVLGCNFIRKNKCVVYPAEGHITVKGRRVDECPVLPAAAMLCETIVIPGRTEVIGRVRISGEEYTVPRVIEPIVSGTDKLGCMIGRCVVDRNVCAMPLRNPSAEAVTVRKNTRLGTALVCAVMNTSEVTDNTLIAEVFDWTEAKRHLNQKELLEAKE